MTLFLTDDDVRAAFAWPEAIAALRAAYAAPMSDAMFPPRTMARGDGLWLRTLSGVLADSGLMGGKMIAASMRNRRASYLIPLFDQETVELVALLDGNSVTGFRTAATSALAVDVLAPAGPLTVGVIGSGFEAQHHVRALAAVREISSVTVFSPNPASRARFVDRLADLGLEMTVAESAPAAVAGADLVICAARSRDESPTLHGAWLEPGMTVVSIGSTLPEQRELDTAAIARAARIVADQVDEVVHETGDMIEAGRAGITCDGTIASLADVVGGRAPGRPSPDAIVIYKSVGAAVQDLAVAAMCVRRATESSAGTVLPVSITPALK
ncbi:ornithine cyclodeaminase family protein [Actinomadura fibrosa]|uniref:Ornithine cyclodeaminase family protein n=1 Tax=Actinomadura fibrosa TaxID=111802 RepID=A0ABW2Y691_9ACTN|nr:ornithine cyclodeaminase family protein [Actinomadura fibrosa]